ncbi:fibronectin type III domain-containing protein [Devosia sp. Root635]|uniref:fibronectin type III domain-containing protein n=1 Tax=Devosia sp. Root635 TaxID=1736575 RepID=UPI000725FE00|nr:fibronectin type III domain-containing protein [Devosia sp. Root635]KRA42029.1 hypothetical protein ASD80_09900 [Devosia sp. Root635]
MLKVAAVLLLWAGASGLAQADVTGTTVSVPLASISDIPVGTQIDLGGGAGTKLIDIDPVNKIITLSTNFSNAWGVTQFEVVFSGGNLGAITGVTRIGGTAANLSSYSASASGKTITFFVSDVDQDNGTAIFSFTSTSTAAPTVTSVEVPANGTYTAADNLDFKVNFDNPVTVTGTPYIRLTVGSTTRYADYVSGSGTSALTFRYDVSAGDLDTDGIVVGTMSANGGTMRSGSGVNATLTLNSVGSTTAVLVDAVDVPDAPTIGTATAGDAQASVSFTANGNGGSAITSYTVTSSPGSFPATGSASPLTVTGLTNGTAYTFTVVATNAEGSSTPSAASNSVTPKGNQTITFNNPGAQNFGTTPTLTATATSALPVSFTSSTTGVCTITSGGVLTFVTAGSCTIDADRAGNSAYNAAATVSQTFTVNAGVPGAPTIGTATAGDNQASVTFTAPASSGGSAITQYVVTANPGGQVAVGPASPITVTGLTNGVSYTFTVAAENVVGTGGDSSASNSVTPAAPQTITFANPGTQNFGTTPTLSATATSASPVSFTSSTTGVCTITTGGTLTFVSAGTCTIDANQVGDLSFLPAPQVSQSFTVAAVVPGAPTMATATPGDMQASVAFVAPASTGGAAITSYTVTTSPADVAPVNGAGSPILVTGLTNGQAYTFTVTAGNTAGTGSASAASNSVTPAAAQTITFANPGSQNFGTTPTLTATSSSLLTPTFTSSTTGVCTITAGGALTFITAGSCSINADQVGNGSYLPASQVTQTFTVLAVAPGVPAGATAVAGPNSATVSFTAPAHNGGAAITSYQVTSSPGGFTATGAASPITVSGLANGTAYSFTVTASNSAGAGSPSAASGAVTPQGAQTITFANPGTQNFGTTPTLTATATSALTVSFSSATAGVCTITAGGVLTTVSTGTCTILADQAGDGSVLPAAQVSQSFTVAAVVPGAPTGVSATGGASTASVAFTAPAFDGGSAITLYTVTAAPGGATASGASSPIAVPGLSNGTAYTFTVAASNAVGEGSASTASAAVIPGTTQTIAFTNPGDQMFSAQPTLVATATSGLTATFTSTTPAVCTITATGVLTPQAVGTCTIAADQPGDPTYQPAPTATESFAILADAITLAPAAGALPAAIAGTAYSQAFTAAGGTAPYSYAITVGALPGDLTLAGGTLSGTPAATGAFSFTVTATDDNGFTASAAYTLDIGAPAIALAPVAGALPKGTAGTVYGQTFGATGGVAPYGFAITAGSLPAGLSLSGGSLAGTPTTAGSSSFTVTATDDNGFTASAAYTLQVDAAGTITLTPAGGALPSAMAGEAYSSAIAAGGHPGPLTFALTAGALPDGMVLNITTGELTGPLNPGTEGDYAFTITASSGDGASEFGSYTLAVGARAVTATDQAVVVPPGATPVPVDLTVGATGGPFTSANVVGVEPPYAGTASIVGAAVAAAGPVPPPASTLYLKFIPNPQFSGTAVVTFTLASALGTSQPAKVSYTTTIDPVGVEAVFGDLSNGFVSARAGLLAGAVDAPGLRDRRNAASANMPGMVQVTPSGNSVTMNFAASTLAATAASAAAQSLALQPVDDSAVNFWIDGTATLHMRADGGTDHWGSMALLSGGADLLVNDQLLVGVALHADWMDDITGTSRATGNGVLAGPYVSAELGEGVFLDASLFYGRSWNEVSTALFRGTFETDRLLAKMRLEGQWALGEDLVLRPSANAFYLHEAAGAYTVSDGLGTTIAVDAFTLNQLRLSAGAVLQYTLDYETFVVRPFIGAELGLSFDGTSQSAFSNVSAGFDVAGDGNWTLGISAKATFEGSTFRALSATGQIGVNF